MTTIRVEIAPPFVEQVVAYLQALPADQRGKIVVEPIVKPDMDTVFEQVMRENDELNKRLA